MLENRVSADGFTLDPITNLQKKSQLFGKEAAVWIFNNTIGDDDWVANKDSIKTIRDLHAYEWLLNKDQQDALDKTCEKVDKEVLGDLQFGSTFIALQIHAALCFQTALLRARSADLFDFEYAPLASESADRSWAADGLLHCIARASRYVFERLGRFLDCEP